MQEHGELHAVKTELLYVTCKTNSRIFIHCMDMPLNPENAPASDWPK